MDNQIMTSNKIDSTDWYKLLIEDCDAIFTETQFNAHWALVEGYHALGSRILEDMSKFEENNIYGKQIVKRIANSIRKGERTLYNAIQFVEKYPDINSLPEGKAITWSKICKIYLPQKTAGCPHADYYEVTVKICNCCGKKIDSLNPKIIEARMV